ncbi:MAG: hypothetical protein AAFY02_10905 [Pseudomonadota bacterium]
MTASRANSRQGFALGIAGIAPAAVLSAALLLGALTAQGARAEAESAQLSGPISGLIGAEGYEMSSIGESSALAPMDGIDTAGWREAPWSTRRWDTPLLDSSEGGLTAAIWVGSDPDSLAPLIARLPSARDSGTAFLLTRRLLLSASAPPPGSDPDSWLALRIERMTALADMQGLQRLMALLPATEQPILRQSAQEAISLLHADRATLCADRAEVADPEPLSLRDRELAIICALYRGQQGPMAGDIDALRQAAAAQPQAEAQTRGFLLLAEAISVGQSLSPAATAELATRRLGILEAQLLHRFSFEEIRPLWSRIDAAGRLVISNDPFTDLRLRTLAREWAVTTERMERDQLAAAYDAFPFIEEDLAAGFLVSGLLEGTTARAFAWQSLKRLNDPGERLALVAWALNQARSERTYAGVAEVLLPRLDFSPEAAAIPGVSVVAGQALYVMGRYEEATAWLLVARREGSISAQSANATWRLWPYARLAGLAMPHKPMGLIAWRSTQSFEPDERLAEREALLLSLLRALGDDMNTGWFGAPEMDISAVSIPSAEEMELLQASVQGRSGETLVRVLNLLGDWSTGEASPQQLALAVEALDRIGLPLEARALAIEAAHRAGI